MDWIIIVNLIAIVLAPIVAVWIAQRLQDRAAKRKDKLDIFKTLMGKRGIPLDRDGLEALNTICVIFSDSVKVMDSWKKYTAEYDSDSPGKNDTFIEMLENMAKSLKINDTVDWKVIKNIHIMLSSNPVREGSESSSSTRKKFERI